MSLTDYINWTYKKVHNEIGGCNIKVILCCSHSHKVKHLVKDINKYYSSNSIRHTLMKMICSFINLNILDLWRFFALCFTMKMWKHLCINKKSIVCPDFAPLWSWGLIWNVYYGYNILFKVVGISAIRTIEEQKKTYRTIVNLITRNSLYVLSLSF